jgi:hypothetical protein
VALLIAGAAAMGVAFDVKLLESLVALPALALLAFLGMPGSAQRRVAVTALAGAVYVAVALSWLTATLLFPAHERPYAIGSTNGSAWNAAFVFNGSERISGKSNEAGSFPVYQTGRNYPQATQAERDRIPIVPPSPTRLLARVGPLSGERLGAELLAALLLGIPALLAASRLPARPIGDRPAPVLGTDAEDGTAALDDAAALRVRRALAASLAVWMACGIVLFSQMARLHPRYVESFTPAVAAMLGVGAAWAGAARTRAQAIALVIALLANVYFVERLIYSVHGIWWLTFAATLGALALLALAPWASAWRTAATSRRSRDAEVAESGAAHASAGTATATRARTGAAPLRERRVPGGGLATLTGLREQATLALTMLALLALPFATDVSSIKEGVTDAGYVGALPSEEQNALSTFLRGHQGSAKYELAAESATGIGSLIVQDARPVLVLTTYNARVFTTVAKLRRLIAAGEVKYAFLNTTCHHRHEPTNAACSEPALWVRAHGTDVSESAGLRTGALWLLPGASA